MIVLYTTGCPKCTVLEGKLKEAGVEFEIVSDTRVMIKKGFMEAPKLEVDGELMDFGTAFRWVNNQMEK